MRCPLTSASAYPNRSEKAMFTLRTSPLALSEMMASVEVANSSSRNARCRSSCCSTLRWRTPRTIAHAATITSASSATAMVVVMVPLSVSVRDSSTARQVITGLF